MNRSISKLALPLFLFGAMAFTFNACKSTNPAGNKVKQPFSGSKYESNNKWFRGIGTGESQKQNIARSKADLDAKNQLAAQVGTNIRAVSDQYLAQTDNADAAVIGDKFQTLVREVMNTDIADLRKFDEETFFNTEKNVYTQYVAYEIKKAAMWRFMKKQALTDRRLSKLELKSLEEMLDIEIQKAEVEED